MLHWKARTALVLTVVSALLAVVGGAATGTTGFYW
jgi:hypothetical protein